MFDSIRKVLTRARDEHALLHDQLQARRRELAAVQAQPQARADVIAATDQAIQLARQAALVEIRERGQRLAMSGSVIPAPGALPVDDRGRVAITDAMLLALLGEPLRQLVCDALAGLAEGISAEQRAAEVSRIGSEIASIEGKLRVQQAAADEAGLTL